MTTPWTDISIDCETLGKRYDAPVIAIGAVFFNRETAKLGATFYQEIDLDSAIKSGQVDGSTVAWWINQSPRARELFDGDPAKKMHLSSALLNFTTFCRGNPAARAWGNGATSDITWLEHAIHKGSVGLAAPWHFTNIRDMRTIVDAANISHRLGELPKVGTHHNALDDAIWQALAITAAWQRIQRGISGYSDKDTLLPKGMLNKVTPPPADEDDEL